MAGLTIAVDFDGVLHDPHDRDPGRRMGKPVAGALEGMRELADRGHELLVFTARPEHSHVADWLAYFGFPPIPVTNIKPRADVYLDDRALCFVSWDQALADLG